jgi:hypothetical protein
VFPRGPLDKFEKPVAKNGVVAALLVPLKMVPEFESVCSALERMA